MTALIYKYDTKHKSDFAMRTVVSQRNGSQSPNGLSDERSGESFNIVAALWRYRWAVILPAVAGLIAGFLLYLRTPETYRSTTRLMLESDRPAILDSMTGDFLGGVPPIDIVQSQLYSDKVVSTAFKDSRMEPFRARFNNNPGEFIAAVQEALVLEPEVNGNRTAQALVMLLHFEHEDSELCEAAVRSFSVALQKFFDEKQKSSRGDLIRLITKAMQDLNPKLTELEKRHRDFRRDAPLTWNTKGEAINPHRERQLFLVQRRSELYEELRREQIQLKKIESIVRNGKEPEVALKVIGQLLRVNIDLKATRQIGPDMRDGDKTLEMIEVDKQLIPLMIERNQFANEYGPNHPNVKKLDAQLATMKAELKRLVTEQTDRILDLMKENAPVKLDPRKMASEALAAVIFAATAEVNLLSQQISEVDAQIATEKVAATQMAKYEGEHISMLREISRNQNLMEQLEEQMSRVTLTEDEGNTQVVELKKATRAYLVGPVLLKMLGIGGCLGALLGVGLAVLLEKNSSTFRNPEEISDMLGVPVLTHVPFFKGRIRKSRKGEINPYKDMDPYLAIVHQPSSVASEAIRSLRTSLFFELDGERGKIIQVTSPLPGDGKSTIAGNLACSIAQTGKRVLAIDCDLRRPQLTDNFSMADQVGISNVLNGEVELDSACHPTALATLRVMPSGPIPTNPAEALTLPDMSEMLEQVRDEYDYIVLDTPPLLVVTDPSITASMVDGVVLTLRVRRKSKPNATESMNILRAVGANVLGVVINNSDEAGTSDGYRGYGYYRYGRYTSRYHRGAGKDNGPNSGKKSRGGRGVVIQGRGATIRQNGSSGQPSDNGRSNGSLSPKGPQMSAPLASDAARASKASLDDNWDLDQNS